MRKLVSLGAAGICLLGISPVAWAQMDGSDPSGTPGTVNVTGMQLLVRHGKNIQAAAPRGQLDKAGLLDCTSASGCTITASAMVHIGYEGQFYDYWKICTDVDGDATSPHCEGYVNVDDVETMLQSIEVGQGLHRIKTYVELNSGALKVIDYELQYTLYDH
jgi:hypothetical protein